MRTSLRFVTILMAFAWILPVSTAAHSQTKKQEKILQMMDVMGMNDMVGQMIGQLKPVIRQQLTAAMPNINPDHLNVILDATEEEMRASQSEMLDLMIPIYDQQLTEEEIDASIAFYSTPVGQSLLRKMPKLVQTSMLEGQKWAQKVMPKVQVRIQEKMKELGYKN